LCCLEDIDVLVQGLVQGRTLLPHMHCRPLYASNRRYRSREQ